jgi:hypothetical protein
VTTLFDRLPRIVQNESARLVKILPLSDLPSNRAERILRHFDSILVDSSSDGARRFAQLANSVRESSSLEELASTLGVSNVEDSGLAASTFLAWAARLEGNPIRCVMCLASYWALLPGIDEPRDSPDLKAVACSSRCLRHLGLPTPAVCLIEGCLGLSVAAYQSDEGLRAVFDCPDLSSASRDDVAYCLANLSDALSLATGRGSLHAARVLEAWLGLPVSAYDSKEELRVALGSSVLREVGSCDAQAVLLTSLSSALRMIPGRGDHAARLLEAWIGVSVAAFRSKEDLISALGRSRLADVEIDHQIDFLTGLVQALRFVNQRRLASAPVLLEAWERWLGINNDDYSSDVRLQDSLKKSKLSRAISQLCTAECLASLAACLVGTRHRGASQAVRLLETWLGLTATDFDHLNVLSRRLKESPFAAVSSPFTQISYLTTLAGALRLLSERGPAHAARLLEAWIGVDPTDYDSVDRLREKLHSSPLGCVEDATTQSKMIGCLADALRYVQARGPADAAMLVDAWLGIDVEMYDSQEAISDALANSPLSRVLLDVNIGGFLAPFAGALRVLPDRGPAQAAYVLGAWLRIPMDSYSSDISLREAVDGSPIRQVGCKIVEVNLLVNLSRALSLIDDSGREYAARLLEVWLDVPIEGFVHDSSPLANVEPGTCLLFIHTWLEIVGHEHPRALSASEATMRFVHAVCDRDLSSPGLRREFLWRIGALWPRVRGVLLARIEKARQWCNGQDSNGRGVLELERQLLSWAEDFENRRLLERLLDEPGVTLSDRAVALATDCPRIYPDVCEPSDKDFLFGYLPRSGACSERTMQLVGCLETRRFEHAGGTSSECSDSGDAWPLRVTEEVAKDLARAVPLQDLVPPGAVWIRTLAGDSGTILWWAMRRSGDGLEKIAFGKSQPDAEERLLRALLSFDLAVERTWSFYRHGCDTGIRDELLPLNSLSALVDRESLDDGGLHPAVAPATHEFFRALLRLSELFPRLASVGAAVLQGARDGKIGKERLAGILQLWTNAISELVEMIDWPEDPQDRETRRRTELERATEDYRDAVERELDLTSIASVNPPLAWQETDVIFQVQGQLLAAPLSLVRIAGEPLYRVARSTSTVLSLTLRRAADLKATQVRAVFNRRLLSSQWLVPEEWQSMDGLALLHVGLARVVRRRGGWSIAGLGQDPEANAQNLCALLSRQGESSYGLAVIGGHGDEAEAGVALADGIWGGAGADLGRLDFLIFVACAIGRLRQSDLLDVEGFCARLVASGARCVVAARWPIADREAATFATELVKEYLEAVDKDGLSAPFLRARALARTRRRLLDSPPDEDARVTKHLASAFDIYGLG